MRETSAALAGVVGCRDLMRTAVEETTVSMAWRPQARIVSPDSEVGVSDVPKMMEDS